MGRRLKAVIDASALLAVLLDEPGAECVIDIMRGSSISAVNASESFQRAVDRGFAASSVMILLRQFEIDVIAFDVSQALLAADLRARTKSIGASLGDRACLALAVTRGCPVYTGDRKWAGLDLGLDIRMIR